MKERKPPFVIGVLANFSGQPANPPPRLRDRRFVTVTKESLAEFQRNRKPRIALRAPVPAEGPQTSPAGLTFERLEEFSAESLARNIAEQGIARVEEAAWIAGQAMMDADYQALYATWTGLRYLVDSVAGNPSVRVKVWDVSRKELLRDVQRASQFDQTALFRKVYQEGIGTFGGEAFGCLIGDYYLTDNSEDIGLIETVSNVAAAARAPFLYGLQPGFLHLERWQDLNAEAAKSTIAWANFCQSQEASRVFPLLPRFAFSGRPQPEEPFGRVWINPAILVASAAGGAYREAGLLESAQNLLPEWSGPASGATATEATGAILAGEVEFECDCPEELQGTLAELGVNALTRASVGRGDFLQSLICAARAGRERGRLTLAHALDWCNLVNRIHEQIRCERS